VVVEFNTTLPQVWVAVVSDGTADAAEIARRCGEVSRLTTPAAVKIVDAIPRNSMGKIMREDLRRLLTQGKS
jgi:acyl-coenzyme A synthetase/AMP-(fatty) acid ligase